MCLGIWKLREAVSCQLEQRPRTELWDEVFFTFLTATGYIKNGAGYITGFFGEQPEDSVGHFFGAAAALHRYLDFYAFNAIGLASGRVDVGIDKSGADGVHSNIFFGHFFRQS